MKAMAREALPDDERPFSLEIPWRTILKLIAAVAFVWLWLELWQILLVFVVAILWAVTLYPVVAWLQARGLSRSTAAVGVGVLLLALVGGFLFVTWSSLSDQSRYLAENAGAIQSKLTGLAPPWLRDAVSGERTAALASQAGPEALRIAKSAISAVIVIALGFVVMVYLLIDGQRTRDWCVAFVPQAKRARAERTLDEAGDVMSTYLRGNMITAALAGVFVFVAMSLLKVPAALLLALFAAVFDFIPIVGVLLAGIPAAALGLTVSGTVGIAALGLYVVYHVIEAYVIAPRVYGGRMELSHLAVILAFAIGAELAGVIGAIIALPLAAIYPTIERIWLRDELPADTVQKHRRIKRAGEVG